MTHASPFDCLKELIWGTHGEKHKSVYISSEMRTMPLLEQKFTMSEIVDGEYARPVGLEGLLVKRIRGLAPAEIAAR